MTGQIKYIVFRLTVILILFQAMPVWSEGIDVEKLTESCVVGESLYFRVTVRLDEEKEIDVSNVMVNNTPLSYTESQSSSSSFSFTINGRTIKQTSGIEKGFVFEIPTEKVGPLKVPSAVIKVGDTEYTLDSMTFMVHDKPVSDNFRLVTQLVHPKSVYYPTQIIEVMCKLYYRDFPGSPSDLQYQLPILSDSRFSLVPDSRQPQGYVMVNDRKFGINYVQGTETINNQEFSAFYFTLKFRLMGPGNFSFTNSVKAQVETGRVMRQRGFFGTELVRERKLIYADSPKLEIQVKDLPDVNVPEGFNGAIGDFKIKVIPSSDTNIKVGDPITLSIEISGRGTWEFVKCPPVDKMTALTDYFMISSDPVPGEVSEDGSQKTFIVPMRVKSKIVNQIPPIPFTFFNLVKHDYVTVYSDPVPIHVFDSAGNVEIVDFGKAPEPETLDEREAKNQDKDLRSTPSLMPSPNAEYLPELIAIRDNVGGTLLETNHAARYPILLFAVIPYLCILLIWGIRKIRKMNLSEKQLAKIRQRTAFQIFRNSIAHLEKKNPDETVYYRDLAQQTNQFMKNRFQIVLEDIDDRLIHGLIDQNKIPLELGKTLLNKYERIQHLRYSNEAFNLKEAKAILKAVKEVLKKC